MLVGLLAGRNSILTKLSGRVRFPSGQENSIDFNNENIYTFIIGKDRVPKGRLARAGLLLDFKFLLYLILFKKTLKP